MHASLAKISDQKGLLVLHHKNGTSTLWVTDEDTPLPTAVIRWMTLTSLGERGRRAKDVAGRTEHQVDAVVETVRGELWSGGVGTNEFWTTLDAACEVRGVPRPTWLDDSQVDAIRHGIDRACAGWADLPIGQRLTLRLAPAGGDR